MWRDGDEEKQEHFLNEEDGIERLTDVVVPSITHCPATNLKNNPRPAVLVCPGGGYGILAWNHEGEDIARWLSQLGFSAFILKYRCPERRDAALADAARAIRLLRANSAQYGILPNKIGIIGFSAGAHLSARLCTLPEGFEPYPPKDSTDGLSPVPDFQMIIYPAYIDAGDLKCDSSFAITGKTPPAFIAQAQDDYYHTCSLAYYIALSKCKVPAELHTFPRGGHGYGLVRNGMPTENWTKLAEGWLDREIRPRN